jgi:hypothetical protein
MSFENPDENPSILVTGYCVLLFTLENVLSKGVNTVWRGATLLKRVGNPCTMLLGG